MALSQDLKERLKIALADESAGDEMIAAVQASVASPAADVAAIGTTSNLVGVNGTGNNAAPLAGTESRLDVIEAKIDEILSAIKAAGLMS